MEPNEAATPGNSQPAAAKPPRGYFKKPLARYGFELLVIVLGISLSLWVDGWRQEREEAKTQRKVLIALADDLENIAAELQEDSAGSENSVAFLLKLEQGEEIPQKEMEDGMSILWVDQYAFFNPSLASYESAISTKAWIDLPDTLRYNLIQLTRGELELLRIMYHRGSSDYADRLLPMDLASCMNQPSFSGLGKPTSVDMACMRQKLKDPTTRATLRLFRSRTGSELLYIGYVRSVIVTQLTELRNYLQVPQKNRAIRYY
jgi:hypothetical protein